MLYLITFCGLTWLIPLVLFGPSVVRVWRGRADALDVMLSPTAFIAANQVGYTTRWLIWHAQIPDMEPGELIMWAGLYTLSSLSALSLVAAWRIARRLR